ncbi:MAG: hypothetical protein Q4G02_02065 [bacterium]|nr:hypothetical protein [bacterium]
MFNLFGKKSEPNETPAPKRFFGLALSEKLAQASLWEVEENVKVLKKTNPKPYFSETDLLVKLDQCLQELGAEGETVHQTLFFLDNSFTSEGEILPNKKVLFENITQSLQLDSLGFVSDTEAVVSAKLEQNPELKQQLVVEFTGGQTIFSLYEKKSLLERCSVPNDQRFAEQMKTALVQLAAKIGVDYSECFAEVKDELAPSSELKPELFVNFISALLPTAELQSKIEQLPGDLPVRAEILGSDILLSYILVPSATILAKSYGWLTVVPEEASEIPPTPPVETADQPLRLSRQKDFPPTVDEGDFLPDPEEKKTKMFSFASLSKKSILVTVILALLTLLVGGFFWIVSQSQLLVTLTPKTSVLAKTLEVTIDPKATASNYDELILPGNVITKEIKTTFPFKATGLREIGNAASGEIEISNKTTQEITFKKGSEVNANDYVYTLDNDVNVSAATVTSTSDGENKVFGKNKVKVTGKTPGSKGNLGQDVSLQVGNYNKNDVEAKVSTAFAGGTDETEVIFSEEDKAKALKDGKAELVSAGVADIGTQEDGRYLVVQTDKLKVTKTTFDTKIGEKASEVTLELIATVPVITYELTELTPLAQAALAKELSVGYELVGEQPDVLSAIDEEKTAADGSKIYLDVNLSQTTAATLGLDTIRNEILGKKLLQAENYLKGLESVKSYTFTWSNALYPKIYKKIPKKADKVEVVNAQQ